ncbi:hypothetical protein Trydic_g1384 [Trypoxylus dichotomus]
MQLRYFTELRNETSGNCFPNARFSTQPCRNEEDTQELYKLKKIWKHLTVSDTINITIDLEDILEVDSKSLSKSDIVVRNECKDSNGEDETASLRLKYDMNQAIRVAL